jgi:NAD(P)-dependent dehydrogenase (short-subunit alcohol dehydrogenase family)
MKLDGRGIVITGANRGLGAAIAKACVAEGANVLICARDAGPLEKVAAELRAAAAPGRVAEALTADVSKAEDVARLGAAAESKLPRVDGIVNNAGVHGPKGLLEEIDIEEWWRCHETNLLGIARMCRRFLPLFRRQGYGKIVNLSGGGATAPMPRMSSYASSKAAVVRLTETLAGETEGSGIDINSVAPGALNTRLLDDVLESGPERVGAALYEKALKQKASGGAPLERAVNLCVFLLSAESDGISGRLLSAVWDPWDKKPDLREGLDRTDIYTLRRIVPGDRGLNWD